METFLLCSVPHGGHRPNRASHFPEVQSDRLRDNKDKLQGGKFRLDVKEK